MVEKQVTVVEGGFEDEVSIQRWRARIAESTYASYKGWLRGYLRMIHRGPDEAVEWAKSCADTYAVLDTMQEYVQQFQKTRRYATLQGMYATLRSFYLHNRIPLPQDRSFRIRADVPPVERQLGIGHLHELIGLATQPWRSMILVKWMALLDTECLLYVDRHYGNIIADAIRRNESPIKLIVPGRKKKRNIRPFFSYIGKDAIDSLRQYFERDRGWPQNKEPIWYYPHKHAPINRNGFSAAWIALLRKARLISMRQGDKTTRYGYNPHNTRDIAISILNTVPGLASKCVEFWAGHEIDPLGYNQFYSIKPDYVLEQYRLAEPHLNIISNPQASSADLKKRDQELAEMRSQLKDVTELVQRITSGEITIQPVRKTD